MIVDYFYDYFYRSLSRLESCCTQKTTWIDAQWERLMVLCRNLTTRDLHRACCQNRLDLNSLKFKSHNFLPHICVFVPLCAAAIPATDLCGHRFRRILRNLGAIHISMGSHRSNMHESIIIKISNYAILGSPSSDPLVNF